MSEAADLVKLAARLPAGGRNGLDALGPELGKHPDDMFVVVAIVDCSQTLRQRDTDTTTATMRIRRIEPLRGMAADKARELLLDALKSRTGRGQLTIADLDKYDNEDE